MVDKMEIESPLDYLRLDPQDRILRRLAQLGVPEEYLNGLQPGLVAFVKDNKTCIPQIVSAILPTDVEVEEVFKEAELGSEKLSEGPTMKKQFRQSMGWIQWLIFDGNPSAALTKLSEMTVGQRGVCGAVWGQNDIAYKCRTCGYDPTCAICVPCFENGNHIGHDYSVIYTGSGCCDCGDVTAWKREGFCSKHKGVEQIQPLSEEFAESVRPVLNALFSFWKGKLMSVETICVENPRASDCVAVRKKFANELTFVIVELLLGFCKTSESLLSFIARLLFSHTGLLDILVRAERFLIDVVVKKLHELLLKLLGEPIFKYEFAKVFLSYYPSVVSDVIKECSNRPLKYPLLSTFSVQIFTVPTLTPRLVKEMNLLAMLMGCLGDIFIYCAGEDGRLQVAKWEYLYEITLRVVEDIRFVMSHVVVPKYVTRDQQDISRTWMKLLAFVQGMNPQKRETGLHIEEENEIVHLPFILCHSIANIHTLLVVGAFSVASNGEADDEIFLSTSEQDRDDGDSLRHAKVGRLSQESSACNAVGRNNAIPCSSKGSDIKSDTFPHPKLPPSVLWLIYECLRAIENCLGVDNMSGLHSSLNSISGSNVSAFKRTLSKIRKGEYTFGRLASSTEDHGAHCSSHGYHAGDLESSKSTMHDDKLRITGEIDSVKTCNSAGFDDIEMEGECAVETEGLHFLNLSDWPEIVYDVSSQDVSVHIPLHRLLSLLLQCALRIYFGESAPNITDACSVNLMTTIYSDFFEHSLGGCHPYGFSGFVMEHPLRIRVFCAEVHAGMWRKNGDAALLCCEWYRSVCWSEEGMEHDLFLLQYCAALAPADLYVNRILERFGLSNYLSLNLERSSEYEPVLVHEMLTLIIQVVKERRFCGLTTAESLKRELIYKLAIGDATHSQLVKSLPRDLSKFPHLQEILDTVAVYSNPSGFNQGMYSLRWAFWKELDLYHPRWNSKDLQVAEERYLRICNVSALTTQLPRWTKIYPPLEGVSRIATCKVALQIIRAVLFYAVFTYKSSDSRAPESVLLTALHLLSLSMDIYSLQRESSDKTCRIGDSIPVISFSCERMDEGLNYGFGEQSLLSLLVLLMRMHKKGSFDNFTEAGACDLSSLIETLLKKFAEIDDGCMTRLQQLAPEVVSHLSKSITNSGLITSGSASDSEKRKAKSRERQAAILDKMRAQQSKFLAISSTADGGSQASQEECDSDVDIEEPKQDVCCLCHDHSSKDTITFLTLLQKSRLVSFVDQGPPSWQELCLSDKERTSISQSMVTERMVIDTAEMNSSSGDFESPSSFKLVQFVQNAVNELASCGPPGDVTAFLRYVNYRFPALRNVHLPNTSNDEWERTCHTSDTLEQALYFSIHREMKDNWLCSNSTNEGEKFSTAGGDLNKRTDARSILLVKYIAALSREMNENPSASEIAQTTHASVLSTSQLPTCDGFPPPDCDGVHLSSCGHAVHQGCLDRYLSSLKERSFRRIGFEGGHIVDPDQGEFLCPVCRRLVNSVLPTLPVESEKVVKQPKSLSFDAIHAASPSTTASEEINTLCLRQGLALLQSAAKVVGRDEFLKALPLKQDNTGPNVEAFCQVLSKMYFPAEQEKLSRATKVSRSVLIWDTIKYSLMSMEIAARCGRTSLTSNHALSAMYNELKSSSGFILSMLLKIVQKVRTSNSLHVLQRFRGIQHFTDSICSGISMDSISNDMSERGDILFILRDVGNEISSSDIQLWNRASDPVLAHDPFSSLMWLLYSLPYPFLSCEASLLSLVHVFYIVSVTQALILYCGKMQSNLSKPDLSDCLVTDIYKVIGEFGCDQQYFMTNYFDSAVDIKDMIRRLSFPYLRRCALLWRILNSSMSSPFCDKDNVSDGSWNAIDEMVDSTTVAFVELNKVQELENIFKIPSLDVVLKDEVIRSLVLKWSHHFCKEFKSRTCYRIMNVTPAVPFELMRLPYVYQDLLQRYIKQRCPECKSVLHEPALCLLCGKLCSPSWKPCCRESGCQTHATACGAGKGIFLLIRRTTILLQRSARQAPWPSPYLDAFGEEDLELRRGKPLYLNEERYAALTYMVASHGLDRSSKVLGQTTIGSIFMI